MDPLTHTLVGASLGATKLGEKSRYAVAALVVGANLPDIDVVSYFAGGDAALAFRRGWTHGVLALLLLPGLLALGLWQLGRWRACRKGREPSLRWLMALSYLAVFTHPCLDWLNTYGMRWLMPFRDTWFYGDSVFIMDPWLWLILGVSWLLGRRASKGLMMAWGGFSLLLILAVGGRAPSFLPLVIGVSAVALVALVVPVERRQVWSRRLAMAGLTVGTAYILGLIGLQAVTEATVRQELIERRIDQERLMVGPVPVDPLTWDVVVKDGGVIRHGRYRWRGGGGLVMFSDSFVAAEEHSAWEAIEQSGQSPGFLHWARFPWLEQETDVDGNRVYLMDARYVRQRAIGFGSAVFDLEGASPQSDAPLSGP